MMMNAAIVEFENSHTECLFSQIEFLKKENFNITLVCSESIENSIANFNNYDHIKVVNTSGNKLSTFISIYRLYRFLNKNFDYVIFNTCSGNKVRNLCLFPLNHPKLIGIIHNIEKIYTSGTQKSISKKVKNYLVLNDGLLENIKPHKNLNFGSFYPIFFPEIEMEELSKDKNELWICVPGQVELSRRNYFLIANTIKNTKLNKNIKFILLGRITEQESENEVYSNLLNEFRSFESQNRIKLFSHFIDDCTFHSYIRKSDYLLPLLNVKDSKAYKHHKISGTNNLAFCYKKPLIIHENFNTCKDFNENSVFFSNKSFVSILNELSRQPFVPMYNNEKWDFDFQQKRYITFIRG